MKNTYILMVCVLSTMIYWLNKIIINIIIIIIILTLALISVNFPSIRCPLVVSVNSRDIGISNGKSVLINYLVKFNVFTK